MLYRVNCLNSLALLLMPGQPSGVDDSLLVEGEAGEDSLERPHTPEESNASGEIGKKIINIQSGFLYSVSANLRIMLIEPSA